MDWQPLFVREGKAEPDGPFEGVPDHLREVLKEWLRTTFVMGDGYAQRAHLFTQVAAAARVGLRREKNGRLGPMAIEDLGRTENSLLTAVAVETLQRMLRLMWPNPDRHSGEDRRVPTQQEAEAVVLAVTIVQWARAGVISSKK